MTSTTTRRKRRTPEQMIADIEARIVAVRQRAAIGNDRPSTPKRTPRPRSALPVSQHSGIEDVLRAAAAELGLARAIAILDEQRQLLRALGGAARDVLPATRRMERVVLTPAASPSASGLPPVSFELYARLALERALDESEGDMLAAARLLMVGKSTMYRKVRRLGVRARAPRELSPSQLRAMGVPVDEPVNFDSYERAAIVRALAESSGNSLAAAKLIGASKSAFHRRMKLLRVPLLSVKHAERENNNVIRTPPRKQVQIRNTAEVEQTHAPMLL
jgi:hypothetical protein